MKIDRRSFVPLYVQLKNIVQRQIMSGELPPGVSLQSEPALGRTYGVSRITVRQALDELEAEGLIRREPGRGTFVATATSKRGLVMGLLFGGMSERTFGHRNDTSFGDLVGGAAAAASQRGALVHPIPLSDDDRLEVALATPTVTQLNGLLVRLARDFTEDVLQALDATGLPYVVIKRFLPPGRASCVYSDDTSGAEAATTHLLGLGHRRIALLLGPPEVGVWDERRLGYEHAHRKANTPVDPSLIASVGYPMDEASVEVTRDMLSWPDPPTAIFAGNDYMAIGVYRAIRELGREPGRDVPVVGYGGTLFATTMYPALTTVSSSGHDFGRVSAELLLDLITGVTHGPQQISVPWHLKVRQSTVWHLNAHSLDLATSINGVISAG
ncbi:MAG TPA: GntR family transcriptional regulator [Chloroflexota bacterium]|nr:GntR family transcriptional regulator [Chloroflexota bacterium]